MELLVDSPLVLVAGPPRSGRSTLAAQIGRASLGRALLVDAKRSGALALDPELGLESLSGGLRSGRLLVVDDADACPGLLEAARRLAARIAAADVAAPSAAAARLVLLGASFPALPAPAGPREEAAAAEARLELGPLSLAEAGPASRQRRWLRGGYPEAFLAPSDEAAFAWLSAHAERLSESRLFAPLPWAPGRARRLLSMLAEGQGQALNESALSRSLGVSRPALGRCLAALGEAGYLRLLPSLPGPGGKRARLAPALYLRDSGLCHSLSGIESEEALLGSARLASSWESYAIEELARALPRSCAAARYRSQDGAGLELVASRGGAVVAAAALRWAKPGAAAPRGARIAARDLASPRNFLVLPEAEEGEIEGGFTVVGLARCAELFARL